MTETTTINIKPGYKKTKLGLIPEDWEVKRIGDLAKIKHGQNQKKVEVENGKYPILGTGGIIGWTDSFLCDKPSVMIGRKGTIDKPIFMDTPFWTVDTLFYTEIKKNIVPMWLYFNFQSVNWYCYNQATGVPSLSASIISNIKISTPCIAEQQAIATCLSTWDTGIQTLTTLITQKEQLKKALMQQLLTGEKRLKGFEDDLQEKPLGFYITYKPRVIDKPEDSFTKLGIRSHCKGTFQNLDFPPEKIAIDKLYEVKAKDLIVNITFAWEGAIAIVKNEDEGALVSHRFPTYTFKKDIGNAEFFRHFIQTLRVRYLLQLISPGGAGRNRVMSKKDFLKLKIKVPNYKEQTAIANILQTADQEIDLLNNKLTALKDQKKGLMQQLLTGRKRLKN